ncbi:hypothetical protein [Oceanobacillus profundus]|uniref:hypothetical protein n=1 Tax=Oceanobacillus TaxID=182709 RepID=UPI0026E2D4BE|nr:hypothetical protein [Oceanobacillus profundus]MDO6448110.1 hypothetical protein [Oceanobacillus profundus]
MRVGDHVTVTDKHETTNGKLVGVKGEILHIDDDSIYPITVHLNNGNLEAFTREELTINESESE